MSDAALRPIEENALLDDLLHRSSRIIRRTREARYELSRSAGWVVVPMRSSAHLDTQEQARLAVAFQTSGHDRLFAIALEDLRGVRAMAYELKSTPRGFELFDQECALMNYVLTPSDFAGLVGCTSDEFLIVAGQRNFVERVVGRSVTEAYSAFEQFATEPDWGVSMRRTLMAVLFAMRDVYPTLGVGEVLRFPS